MFVRDLVVGAWYKSKKTKHPLYYSSHEFRSDDIVEFHFYTDYGYKLIFPTIIPPWANEVAEIQVEPLSSLEKELL
jgi:hypothetical protein